jgi:hypothetical protein
MPRGGRHRVSRRRFETVRIWPAMNNLGDEAEAFFRSGDEGTYEGGPATLVPLVLEDEPADALDLRSTDEWLARRRRLKRFVGTVVGGLSAGLIILSVCLLGTRARSADDDKRGPQPASLPRVTNARISFAPTAVAARSDIPTLPTEAKDAPEPAPSLPPPARRVVSMRSTPAPSPRRLSLAPGHSKAIGTLPRASADLPALSSALAATHVPPTAQFPN